MKLECADGVRSLPFIVGLNEEKLARIFDDDNDCKRGEFVILSKTEQEFIQAAGQCKGPYVLEYRDGSADAHFQCCDKKLSKTQVKDAFLKYFRSDPSWKNDFSWGKLELKPWWKFW